MAKSEKQKQKLLYIMQCLLERTDETHFVTTQELIDYLAANGIASERKSIYHDIDTRKFDTPKAPQTSNGLIFLQISNFLCTVLPYCAIMSLRLGGLIL